MLNTSQVLTSSSQLSAAKSTSSATLAVAHCHTSVVCPDVSAVPQPTVATSNRFSLLGDEVDNLETFAGTVVDPLASPLPDNCAAEPVGPNAPSGDQIPSGAVLPAPCGESVAAASNSSAAVSPYEPSLQLHLSMSEQPAEPVVSLANPSPVGGTVAPSADTSGSQTPVGTPPPVSPFVPASDHPASSAAEFSPPPVPSRQALVPSLTLGSPASTAAGSPCSFALAVSLDSSSLPSIRQREPLFPESPDLFSLRSADSEGPLMTLPIFQSLRVFRRVNRFMPCLFFQRRTIFFFCCFRAVGEFS
jgi:hypothetical protein